VESGGEGSEKVSFYFLWTNPSNTFAFINPFTFVIATGYIETDADRAYWSANTSNVAADAQFYFWQWWQPSSAPLLSASTSLGAQSAVAEYFQTDSRSQSIAAGVRLDAGTFAVPPYATAVFEVAVTVSYLCNTGNSIADFESGNFNVTCPLVASPVVQSPF
jgi:hypothetical protein